MEILLLKNITNIYHRTIKIVLMATISLALLQVSNASAQSKKEKSNYQLQAELVYNFMDHVTWLEQNIEVKNLCVMDDNPVIPYLNFLTKNNKNIAVIRKYENDYLEDCNVLFINEFYQGYTNRLLFKVRTKSILTFSNAKDFAKNGGIVQFTLRNSRVEFTLNIKEMRSSQLRISNNIISISDVID